ncbi:hypothetical protein F5Y15DRAFT_424728 [Xylariaceae sp. FL0016]|nr:hypothetical protein F5Y15DRAFT_424728 [Xylariaceae sp. FL0016]
MGGLIPLLLPSSAGSRSNAGIAPSDRRRQSCQAPSSSSSSLSVKSLGHRRQQSLPTLRPSRRAPIVAPAAIAVIPYTPAEWRRAVDDVKRKYAARRYRSCSTRCCEILDNLRPDAASSSTSASSSSSDQHQPMSMYLIYLHFYAASSLEWCARPLSSSSNYRTKLLRDARSHYRAAEALINATESDLASGTRSPSSASCSSSSCSPGLSTGSSRASSTSGSALSSPRTSLFSPDDEDEAVTAAAGAAALLTRRATTVKPKKKVSFSGLPELIEFQPEPYIRPDSPTLGWEDDFLVMQSQRREQQQQQQSEDMAPRPSALKRSASFSLGDSASASATRTGSRSQDGSDEDNHVREDNDPEPEVIFRGEAGPRRDTATETDGERHPSPSTSTTASPSSTVFDLDAFLQTRSINRVCASLAALRAQVSWHRDAVEALLAVPPDEVPATPCLPPSSASLLGPGPPPVGAKSGGGDEEEVPPVPRLMRANTLPLSLSSPRAGGLVRGRGRGRGRGDEGVASPGAGDDVVVEEQEEEQHKTTTTTTQHPRPASAASSSAPSSATVRDSYLQERIERLRAGGWQRKRFDSRRYEALREQVMGELGA